MKPTCEDLEVYIWLKHEVVIDCKPCDEIAHGGTPGWSSDKWFAIDIFFFAAQVNPVTY